MNCEGRSSRHNRNTENGASTPEVSKGAPEAVTGPRSSSSSTVRWYNCKTNGHIARDCPKPRKPCSICKSTSLSRLQCRYRCCRCVHDARRDVSG
ncbi:Uncharacterized protein FWK35_00017341 [Aphis craccivora]|uniref:CCHC-type domain-containing protein n=1 Tax=Aphis craccivora TaxID=307492 RepID=A0A6G0Y966_APHCR|nr:Uncharacterized protein FWK35_00017341 [Aphis craccivora]